MKLLHMHMSKNNYRWVVTDNYDVNLIINNFHFPSHILPPPRTFIRFEYQYYCYKRQKGYEKENISAVSVNCCTWLEQLSAQENKFHALGTSIRICRTVKIYWIFSCLPSHLGVNILDIHPLKINRKAAMRATINITHWCSEIAQLKQGIHSLLYSSYMYGAG
jgi:hypothetical protein